MGERRDSSRPGPPSNFVRAVETGLRVIEELREGSDPDAEIAKRQDELRQLIAPIDAVHLLGQLLVSESILDPDTYTETEHPGAAYVVELVAAQVVTRPERRGGREQTPAIDARVLDGVRRLTAEATFLESIRRYAGAGGWAGPEGAAKGRAASHHLYLRNPGWPWQEHATLRGLFGAQRFSERLRAELGFDCEDAIRCSEAGLVLITQGLGNHMAEARESSAEFGPEHPAYRWAESALDPKWKESPDPNAGLYMTGLWAMIHMGDGCLISPRSLATAAKVDESAASGFLSVLATDFGQADDGWFALAERIRNSPFLRVDNHTYFLTVPGADLWALRPTFERVFKGDTKYLDHRARWLEQYSSELISAATRPDEVRHSLKYEFIEDDGETVAGEIDALLRYGSTAVLIEAKSATMRPGARRGGEALISHLRDNLTKAAGQSTRAQKALGGGAALREAGVEVELGGRVHEILPVVVTLDDLSSVAPVLWELQGTRVMPEGVTLPWVVTLHELDQVAETVEWPPQLIHFLRRRSRLNEIGGQVASDELDWWMHYLRFGLYFEEEPEAARTRHTSLTDPLDAWMLYEHGEREKPAEKPAMKLPGGSRTFLDLVCDERPDGWIPAACNLLEADSHSQEMLWKELRKMRKRARKRNRTQRFTHGYTEGAKPMLVCVVVAPEAGKSRLLESLRIYVAERIEESGAQRVLGIGNVVSSKRPYDALLLFEPYK